MGGSGQHSYTRMYQVTPTLDTGVAYAAGDVIGTAEAQLLSVTNEGSGCLIASVVVVDLEEQDSAIDLVFFSREPSNTTFTNNGAFDPADADLITGGFVGVVSIAATDYKNWTDNSVATVTAPGLLIEALNDDLWVVVVSQGTPTWGTNGSLVIGIVVAKD